MDFLQNIVLPGFISSGTALLILRVLSKSLLKNALQKDLEKFRTQLQEKTEYLKTTLSIYAKEQDISYQRVDSQRANAIHLTYLAMCDTSILLSRIIIGPVTKTDSVKNQAHFYLSHSQEILKATTKLNTTLRQNAIYFNNETYCILHEYFEISATLTKDIQLFLVSENSQLTIENIELERIKLEKTFYQRLKAIHEKITDSFRYILGIEKEKQYKERN